MMATRHSLNLCSSSILIVIAILILKRLPLRAQVPPALRGDSAAISGGTPSMAVLAPCAIEFCDYPLCTNTSAVPDVRHTPSLVSTQASRCFSLLGTFPHSPSSVLFEAYAVRSCAAVAPLNEHSCFLYDCSVSTDTDECCCVPHGC